MTMRVWLEDNIDEWLTPAARCYLEDMDAQFIWSAVLHLCHRVLPAGLGFVPLGVGANTELKQHRAREIIVVEQIEVLVFVQLDPFRLVRKFLLQQVLWRCSAACLQRLVPWFGGGG